MSIQLVVRWLLTFTVPSNLKLAILGLIVPILTLYSKLPPHQPSVPANNPALALLGCISTSPGIPALFLFLLQVDQITLRVGYFGKHPAPLQTQSPLTLPALCSLNNATAPDPASNSTSSDGTVCVSTLGTKPEDLASGLYGNTNPDVVSVLSLALKLQRDVLIPLIILAAILIFLGAAIFALLKITQMKLTKAVDPSTAPATLSKIKIFKPIALALLWVGVLFAFGAAIGSTMGIGALNFIIPQLATNISVTAGKLLQTIQYMAFIFALLLAAAANVFASERVEREAEIAGGAGGIGGAREFGDPEPYNAEKGVEGGEYDPNGQDPFADPSQDPSQQYPDGVDPSQYPDGQYPEGVDPSQYPEGVDPAQYPDGIDPSQYPEGVDPQAYAEAQAQQQAQQQAQYAEGAEGVDPQQAAAQGQEYAQPEGPDGQYTQEQYDQAAYAQAQAQAQAQGQQGQF